MAAILTFQPVTAPQRPAPAGRPSLVLLEGGRAPARMAVVYRRRRVAVLAIGVLLLVLSLAGARAGLTAVTPQAPPPASTDRSTASGRAQSAGAAVVVVVRPGDTLWSIARRLEPGGDVRHLVDRLAAAHGPAPLQPGEAIALDR